MVDFSPSLTAQVVLHCDLSCCLYFRRYRRARYPGLRGNKEENITFLASIPLYWLFLFSKKNGKGRGKHRVSQGGVSTYIELGCALTCVCATGVQHIVQCNEQWNGCSSLAALHCAVSCQVLVMIEGLYTLAKYFLAYITLSYFLLTSTALNSLIVAIACLLHGDCFLSVFEVCSECCTDLEQLLWLIGMGLNWNSKRCCGPCIGFRTLVP